jgi:hypothetical protein
MQLDMYIKSISFYMAGWIYIIIGSHFAPLEGKFLLIALISYCKSNIKCDSASNAPNCPLNDGVSIVQKLVKFLNTSTSSQQVEITLFLLH